MARTENEIYELLEIKMSNSSVLAGLVANASKTAIWRLFLWVFAYGSNQVETLYDAFVAEVELKGQAAKVGNLQWYRARVLEFQYGDLLVYLNDLYQYAVLNLTKRIVTHCAVTEGFDGLLGGVLNIKVAKTSSGLLTALDNTEAAALTAYIQKVRFAGTKFKLITTNGDILKIGFDVYYDPILPLATVKDSVELTVTNFVKNLPFDGVLSVTKLIDALQLLDSVKDVIFTEGASKPFSGGLYSSFTRIINPYGGHFKISTASGETLADTINYIAN